MPNTLTPSDIVNKDKTVRHTRSRNRWKIVNTVGQGTPRNSSLSMARFLGDVERLTTSKQCASQCGRQEDWRQQRSGRSIHDIMQNELQLVQRDQHDRSIGSVKIKLPNFENVKSVIFAKLESNTSQNKFGCNTQKGFLK